MDFILALILIFLEILFEVVVTGLFIGLYALLRFLAMCLEFVYLAVTKGPAESSPYFRIGMHKRTVLSCSSTAGPPPVQLPLRCSVNSPQIVDATLPIRPLKKVIV